MVEVLNRGLHKPVKREIIRRDTEIETRENIWPLVQKESPFSYASDSETQRKAKAAWSRNSLKAYYYGWKYWLEWASTYGVQAYPAPPEEIARYITGLDKDGLKVNTIVSRVAAIAYVHKHYWEHDPTKDRIVRQTLRGIKRESEHRVKQAAPFSAEVIDTLLETISKTDRCTKNSKRPYREEMLAYVLLLCDEGMRLSEPTYLLWSDLTPPNGPQWAEAMLKHSKADPTSQGVKVALTPRTWRALEAWREVSRPSSDDKRIFRWKGHTYRQRLMYLLDDAGLSGRGFSSHSGRVGMAVRLTEAGMPMTQLAARGRWKTSQMPIRYASQAVNHGLDDFYADAV